ncbi:MAG: hypothetical protein LBQ80_03480 [Clostridium sp.]|nr:hypothetical protein [Clostridium sp.]
MKKRAFTILLALLIAAALSIPALAQGEDKYYGVALANELERVLEEDIKIPEDGTANSQADWILFAISLDGEYRSPLPDAAVSYAAYAARCVETAGDSLSLNDAARWLLALRSVQANGIRTNIEEELLGRLLEWDYSGETLTGSISYAIIAIRAYYGKEDEKSELVVSSLATALLGGQRKDGGYNYLLKEEPGNEYSKDSDPDSTAAAMTALWLAGEYTEAFEPEKDYKSAEETDAAVLASIARAYNYLKAAQLPSGGFGMFGESAESDAQVIIALCTMGVDPNGFSSAEGKSVVDSLESFRTDNHMTRGADGQENLMSSYQTLLALNALKRFEGSTEGLSSIYSFAASSKPVNEDPMLNYYIAGAGIAAIVVVVIVSMIARRRYNKKHAEA